MLPAPPPARALLSLTESTEPVEMPGLRRNTHTPALHTVAPRMSGKPLLNHVPRFDHAQLQKRSDCWEFWVIFQYVAVAKHCRRYGNAQHASRCSCCASLVTHSHATPAGLGTHLSHCRRSQAWPDSVSFHCGRGAHLSLLPGVAGHRADLFLLLQCCAVHCLIQVHHLQEY